MKQGSSKTIYPISLLSSTGIIKYILILLLLLQTVYQTLDLLLHRPTHLPLHLAVGNKKSN